MFKTQYGQAIVRVLQAYPFGSRSLIVALEAVVTTAMGRVVEESRNEIAQNTCRGLHPGEPSGVICLRCFDAAEAGHMPPDEEEAKGSPESEKEDSEIAEQVKMLLNLKDGEE